MAWRVVAFIRCRSCPSLTFHFSLGLSASQSFSQSSGAEFRDKSSGDKEFRGHNTQFWERGDELSIVSSGTPQKVECPLFHSFAGTPPELPRNPRNSPGTSRNSPELHKHAIRQPPQSEGVRHGVPDLLVLSAEPARVNPHGPKYQRKLVPI